MLARSNPPGFESPAVIWQRRMEKAIKEKNIRLSGRADGTRTGASSDELYGDQFRRAVLRVLVADAVYPRLWRYRGTTRSRLACPADTDRAGFAGRAGAAHNARIGKSLRPGSRSEASFHRNPVVAQDCIGTLPCTIRARTGVAAIAMLGLTIWFNLQWGKTPGHTPNVAFNGDWFNSQFGQDAAAGLTMMLAFLPGALVAIGWRKHWANFDFESLYPVSRRQFVTDMAAGLMLDAAEFWIAATIATLLACLCMRVSFLGNGRFWAALLTSAMMQFLWLGGIFFIGQHRQTLSYVAGLTPVALAIFLPLEALWRWDRPISAGLTVSIAVLEMLVGIALFLSTWAFLQARQPIGVFDTGLTNVRRPLMRHQRATIGFETFEHAASDDLELCQFRRGFTLIELAILCAIGSILIALILSVVSSVRQTERRMVCTSNLWQIGVAIHAYAADNQGEIPTVYDPSGSGFRPTSCTASARGPSTRASAGCCCFLDDPSATRSIPISIRRRSSDAPVITSTTTCGAATTISAKSFLKALAPRE